MNDLKPQQPHDVVIDIDKEYNEKLLLKKYSVDTIVIEANDNEAHFLINREGTLIKVNYINRVFEGQPEDNTEGYINLELSDEEDDCITVEQEETLEFIIARLMWAFKIKYIDCRVKGLNAQYIADKLELICI